MIAAENKTQGPRRREAAPAATAGPSGGPGAPAGSRSIRAGGFTLIEMLVVVLIVMVAAAASLPTLLRIGREARLKAAAREVDGYFRGAQDAAITRGRFFHLRWADKNDRGYMEACSSITPVPPADASTPWDPVIEAAPDLFSRAGGLLLPEGFRFAPPEGILTFYPDGSVPAGAGNTTVRVEDAQDTSRYVEITVYCGAGLVEMKGPAP